MKSPSESKVDVRYDFGTEGLKDLYIDSFGNILMGKLLEDLDALAGNVAFFHCDDNNSQEQSDLSLVTAGVEKIKFERKGIPLDNDLLVTGQVVYTGSSSLDVLVEAHIARSDRSNDPQKIKVLDPVDSDSRFCLQFSHTSREIKRQEKLHLSKNLICLDLRCLYMKSNVMMSGANRSYAKDDPEGKVQPREASIACARAKMGHVRERKSIINMPALHAHNNYVLQETTALENSFICEPQKSNTGGRVFGGFLINKAYMLAQANAYLFSGLHSTLTMVDKITFRRPVEISDLIRLRSRCAYCSNESPKRMVIQVTCDVVHPERGESFQSNNFVFVFTCSDTSGSSVPHNNRKMIVPMNRLEAEYLFNAAVHVLGLQPEAVENEFLLK